MIRKKLATKVDDGRLLEDTPQDDQFIERKIVTGLITSDEFISHISKVYSPNCLASSAARLLASWCFEFHKQYGKAPHKDIEGIYVEKCKKEMSKNHAQDIENILTGLSNDYVKEQGQLDKYLLDKTITYFCCRQAKIHAEALEGALQTNNLDEFYRLHAEFKPMQINTPEKIDIEKLYTTEQKPVEWLVEDLLPKGLTIFGGKSKLGKSYLMMYVAVNLAQGKSMFSDESWANFQGERGDILYLALEDIERRIQTRLREIDPNPRLPQLKRYLDIRRDWPPFYNGGVDAIEQWLRDKGRPKLVVIDVLEKFAPRSVHTGAGRWYSEEYSLYGPLADVAHRHNVSIVAVTHTKKSREADVFDEIYGGAGAQGPADTLMVLSPVLGSKNRRALAIRGKDIEENHLIFETAEKGAHWICLGDKEEVQMSEERQSICEYIDEKGTATYSEIVEAAREGTVKAKPSSVKLLLRKMEKENVLEQDRPYGRYSIAGTRQATVDAAISRKLLKEVI
jgi:predicted transcriptional regulator